MAAVHMIAKNRIINDHFHQGEEVKRILIKMGFIIPFQWQKCYALVKGLRKVIATGGRNFHYLATKQPSCLQVQDYLVDSTDSSSKKKGNFYSTIPGTKPPWSTVDNLTDHLLENIMFENEHVVALNKPSGLSLHIKKEGNENDEKIGLTDVMPLMQQRLNVKYLETVVGINRHYSGVILLAKSKEMFQKLKTYYRSSVPAQQILPYTFWGLTIKVPEPGQGADKFIIARKKVGQHLLTFFVDNPSNRAQQRREYLQPFVRYTVLDHTNTTKCALVEYQPTTGKWDFLQLYTVTKLATLLGDHIYSSRLRSILGRPVFQDQYTAIPQSQILSKLTLQSLGISKEDTDKIPLHLHHKKLIVPKLTRKSQRIELEAPLPHFFTESMHKLGFSREYSGQSNDLKDNELVEELPSEMDYVQKPVSTTYG